MTSVRSLTALTLVLLFLGAVRSRGDDGGRIEELEKRIELLERRIRQLESPATPEEEPPDEGKSDAEQAVAPSSPDAAPPTDLSYQSPPPRVDEPTNLGDLASEETRLPISGYMDFHFNKVKDEGSQLDFHRFVLLFGHSFTDRIQFWSELEIEHGFVSGEGEFGELELEQAYLDFLVKPWMNFRAGMMLAPVGILNERHEPPSFQGVERTFVDTVIVPSTWFDSGAGLFGDLGKGFVYKAYVMSPLDAKAFDAGEGLRGGRQKGFQSVTRNVAYTGRLEYHGLPGLSLGTSFWTGNTGFNLPDINPRVRLVEFDGRYTVDRLDFRGQFADVSISHTGELNSLLQRGVGVNPNIARNLRGWYGETGYHLLPRRMSHDVVAFFRYENFDTQRRMAQGFFPLKQFDREAYVIGATYYPEPDVAIKFDYSILNNQSSIIRARNSFNVGLGWWF